MVFAIHWHVSAMDLHVYSVILNPCCSFILWEKKPHSLLQWEIALRISEFPTSGNFPLSLAFWEIFSFYRFSVFWTWCGSVWFSFPFVFEGWVFIPLVFSELPGSVVWCLLLISKFFPLYSNVPSAHFFNCRIIALQRCVDFCQQQCEPAVSMYMSPPSGASVPTLLSCPL